MDTLCGAVRAQTGGTMNDYLPKTVLAKAVEVRKTSSPGRRVAGSPPPRPDPSISLSDGDSLKKNYLCTFRGGEGERERNTNVWLPLVRPLLGTWPTAQACALTGNRTGYPLVCRPMLNPLSPTSQGSDGDSGFFPALPDSDP